MAGTVCDICFVALHLFLFLYSVTGTRWNDWWEYNSLTVSGPLFWGKLNPDWKLCDIGQQQSPINIEPSRLLFDPNLKHLHLESAEDGVSAHWRAIRATSHQSGPSQEGDSRWIPQSQRIFPTRRQAPEMRVIMKGLIKNTGHDFTVELQGEGYSSVNISLGPLSYNYRAAQIKFHLANRDDLGSEHHIAGRAFPVEMHVIAYNSDLYTDLSTAMKGVKGLVIVAVFLEIGKDNKPFFKISQELKRLRTKGSRAMAYNIDIKELLPKTDHYITYDGSLTQPGCYETVTWIIYNKPLTISRDQLSSLRVLHNPHINEVELREAESPGEKAMFEVSTVKTYVQPLMHNIPRSNSRPLMPVNQRVVRTNINVKKRSRLCTMEREMTYKVNKMYVKT